MLSVHDRLVVVARLLLDRAQMQAEVRRAHSFCDLGFKEVLCIFFATEGDEQLRFLRVWLWRARIAFDCEVELIQRLCGLVFS